MLAPNKMAEEVEKLNQEMRNLQKINVKARENPPNLSKIQEFKRKLTKTMKFCPKNAMDKIEMREDKDFLAKMIEDRYSASLGPVDTGHSIFHQRN